MIKINLDCCKFLGFENVWTGNRRQYGGTELGSVVNGDVYSRSLRSFVLSITPITPIFISFADFLNGYQKNDRRFRGLHVIHIFRYKMGSSGNVRM